MREFTVSVRKVTDIELMREACEMTFNGHSKQSLLSIYKSEHSPVRTQMFWVKFDHIPLFVATHLLRHHVGSVPYQLTCRDDRDGGNPGLQAKIDNMLDILSIKKIMAENGDYDGLEDDLEDVVNELKWCKDNTDRYTPVNLGLFLNAQSLIDMAKLRLCFQAHKETIEVFKALKEKIREVDPELAEMMVPKCVYRNGLCGETRCCGYNTTTGFQNELNKYLENYSSKQRGINTILKDNIIHKAKL